MMRMTVLASGSKGNCTVISSSKTRVLVDAGLSCREILKRMALANEDASTLDAILITHEHQDHVAGLSVLARKLKIPVYFTEPTHRAWVRMLTPNKKMTYAEWLRLRQREKAAGDVVASAPPNELEAVVERGAAEAEQTADSETQAAPAKADLTFLPALEFFRAGEQFSIGDIEIQPFTIPHDAADPCGFVLSANGIRMAMATDLGYMPPNVKAAL
ncbi:MAG: MBL fold metallo-hydrolase, partial [Acidobacteriaceae bacterium]|nr:MBL fold metallo-hydrolase [Acidobacteriaceae bacterium]